MKINDGFLNECLPSWFNSVSYQHAESNLLKLAIVDETAEIAVRFMLDFHNLLSVEEDQKFFYYGTRTSIKIS